jgi:hypothetical protein
VQWEVIRCRVTLSVLPGLLCARLISPLNSGAAGNEGHLGGTQFESRDGLEVGTKFSFLVVNDIWNVFEDGKLKRIFGPKEN